LDLVLWNDWHVVADANTLDEHRPLRTALLGVPLRIARDKGGSISISKDDGGLVHGEVRHGFVWACLGLPAQPIIDIPELGGEAKCAVSAGAMAVYASAGRVIENFLDLAHLGYVHAGYLGAEPNTMVESYEVTGTKDGVRATRCKTYQPIRRQSKSQDFLGEYVHVEYNYIVERPYIACFEKSFADGHRFMVMYIFAQPVDEEHTVAHTLLILLDEIWDVVQMRAAQQLVFMQDKGILENQFPKRLPIGAGMEMPVRADRTSVAYRRWLADCGVTYGVIRSPMETAA
jgi:phenylpropionate dioxygenase-like ring-hydroxylating dioxygenase large terminal subunit